LLGTLPLASGVLLRSRLVLDWAARETSTLIAREFGVTARYELETHLWPLQLRLRGLVIEASDGGSPVLHAQRVVLMPRLFSLLAGHLDAGEIEVDAPRGRLVLGNGQLKNLKYRLPTSKSPSRRPSRAPFASLSVNDARFQLEWSGVAVDTGSVDLDLSAEPHGEYELGVRASTSTLQRTRELGSGVRAVDEDVVCGLALRARVDRNGVLIRRFSLIGAVDLNPARGTRPVCEAREDEQAPERIALRLSQLRIDPRVDQIPLLAGHVTFRAPLALVNRFVDTLPLKGWMAVAAEVRQSTRPGLPEARGKLRGGGIQFERYRLARNLNVDFDLGGRELRLPRAEVGIADGTALFEDLLIRPLDPGVPLRLRRMSLTGGQFSGLMRDLGVTPNTVVAWDMGHTLVSDFRGTIQPLQLDGSVHATTRDFEVSDRAFHDPARKRMIGVRAADVRAHIGVRPQALEFSEALVTFGSSRISAALVSIGFDNQMNLDVRRSSLELADISPLAGIPIAGKAELAAQMTGPSGDPVLTGEIAARGFEFGGFPLGDVAGCKVRFVPLKVDFTELRGRKNKSEFRVPFGSLDFGQDASLVAEATVESARLELRDFLQMFRFDQDPRFADLRGISRVRTRVRYHLGGGLDRCQGGRLRVGGQLDLEQAELLGEDFDGGTAQFELEWADRAAAYRGLTLDVPSLTLKKGSGLLAGSLSVKPGAKVAGHIIATAIPAARLQGLGGFASLVDARVSGTAELGGTLDELSLDAQASITPWRIGTKTLPASELSVQLRPITRPIRSLGTSRCGQPIGAPFDRAEYDRDLPLGAFRLEGSLFGGQVRITEFSVTRQRHKRARGTLSFNQLDLGALAELLPDAPLGYGKLVGRTSGKLVLDRLELDRPAHARAALQLGEFSVHYAGLSAELKAPMVPIRIAQRKLNVQGLTLAVSTQGGLQGIFDLKGSVNELGATNELDAELNLRRLDLSRLASLWPRIERAQGALHGGIRLQGPPGSLRYSGGVSLQNGELVVRGLPAPVSDLSLEIGLEAGEIRIRRGMARLGNGTVSLTGSAPLRGFRVGAARARVNAKDLLLPLAEGIKTTVDADLVATFEPSADDAESARKLPRVAGDVMLKSFVYQRPVTLSADIASLGHRGKRTAFESYDPADDLVEFDLTLRSARPLRISNNLMDANLATSDLMLAGTNQRFGLRGNLRFLPGGRLRLRHNEFEIRQGLVHFDDLTRIAPQVDVTATTEYRRYAGLGNSSASSSSNTSTAAGSSTAGGRWLITVHAYGDAERLKVDLSSEPSLAQDDVFLLLTVGVTRAELDQTQSASLGESVALEALGTLTGADRAVREAVPVIDEFRFGSAYSSRTGRTEPTVTIGKRLAERIRANVTSGLAESREVRSNLEWQLSRRVSVQGSYDNVNDISSSTLGNLGADVRWRLEFE
jgi:translocation and assembly module TamB